jgi:hypothetical protein
MNEDTPTLTRIGRIEYVGSTCNHRSRSQYGIWSRGRIGGYEQSVAMVDTQYILRCEDIY